MKKFKTLSIDINSYEPDYLSGISSILDLGATNSSFRYNPNQNINSDYQAIKNDWAAIGSDLEKSIIDVLNQ